LNGLEEEVDRIVSIYPKLRPMTYKSIVKQIGTLYNYWYDVPFLYTHTPVGGYIGMVSLYQAKTSYKKQGTVT